jgi:hypothetical protein
MAAPAFIASWGQHLTEADYQALNARWITRELADNAGLRRVDSLTRCQMFSRKRGDLSGIIIPNVAPWDPTHVREYRERLDNPELEYRADGSTKETNKYIQPPGRGNLIYFPPGVREEMLLDTSIPVFIVEGEFKAISLWRLADHQSAAPRLCLSPSVAFGLGAA